MMRYVLILLAAALVAALFGFGGMGSYSWPGAQTFFYLFLVLAAIVLVFGSGMFRQTT